MIVRATILLWTMIVGALLTIAPGMDSVKRTAHSAISTKLITDVLSTPAETTGKTAGFKTTTATGGEGTGLIGTAAAEGKVFRVYEIAVGAASQGSKPYFNGPSVQAKFQGISGEAAGKVFTIKGFWDGGNVWRLRFAPTAPGVWIYETSSSDPGLAGVSGKFTAIEPTQADFDANILYHGFLVPDGYSWKLSDGTPFLPVGDTQWSFSEEFTTEEWERWMSARQAQNYNTFLGSAWLAKYTRPIATVHAFPNKDPQTEDLQVAFFQRLDHLVQYANDHGIMMGLTIGGFPGDSKWFKRFDTRERNDRWFKYIISRYSAYNVRWVLYGEANEANPPWGKTWSQEAAHNAQLVKAEDPYKHPLGNHHNSVDKELAANPNIDYIEVQIGRTEDQYRQALKLRKYRKPIWFEEYWYEAVTRDNEYELGIRNTHRNFVAAMAFPTMGSLMRDHYPCFDVNQVEFDPGAIRMSYFADFFQGLDMENFSPASHLVDRGHSGKFGEDYAIFLQGGGDVMLDLRSETGSYQVFVLDINSGRVDQLGAISGGSSNRIRSGSDKDVSILVTKRNLTTKAPDEVKTYTEVASLDQATFLPMVMNLKFNTLCSP